MKIDRFGYDKNHRFLTQKSEAGDGRFLSLEKGMENKSCLERGAAGPDLEWQSQK